MSTALSIRQPWAWAIVSGHKDIENRSWSTKYRGPLLIHAGKVADESGFDQLTALGVPYPPELLDPDGATEPGVQRGALIGRVLLADVVTDSASRWAEPGMYHLVLAEPKRMKPVPCRGRLRLFSVP